MSPMGLVSIVQGASSFAAAWRSYVPLKALNSSFNERAATTENTAETPNDIFGTAHDSLSIIKGLAHIGPISSVAGCVRV